MRVNRFFEVLFFVLILASEFVWSQTNYSLDVSLKVAEETLQVSQTIEYVNAENKALNKLYLYDWANSYQGAPAPLANHLANEFNRSFYISSNSKLGYSQMEILGASNISSWSRLADQLDIIKINLDKELEPGDTLKIDLKYLVKIPDDKFTGVGINSSKGILLRDLFIGVAPRYDGEWLLNSNLGFRDYSGTPSSYEFNWEYPATYSLFSNLSEKSSQSDSLANTKTSQFIDKNISSPEFVFDLKDSFKTIKISENFSIVTDILPNKNADVDFEASLQRIDAFTKKTLKPLPNKKLLVLKKDYARNPLVGITQALAFLNPFPDDFIYETRFIKSYLASFLNDFFM